MNLADMIAGGLSARVATLTLATVATDDEQQGQRVASVATVTVANSPGAQSTHDSKALAALVRRVGAAWAFSPAEVDEAVTVALAKPDEARECFEALAAEIPATDSDDRMTCRECRNRSWAGVCRAAAELTAAPSYSPDPAIRRRCEAFQPMPSNPDQRTGAQRWPGLGRGRS